MGRIGWRTVGGEVAGCGGWVVLRVGVEEFVWGRIGSEVWKYGDKEKWGLPQWSETCSK
jgi:hypothetical protein